MRLYFFPALLPLAPLLPWLLTALGALASVLRSVRKRRRLRWLTALLFIIAGALALWQRSRVPSAQEGSRMTPTASLPKTIPGNDSAPASLSKGSPAEGRLTEAWYRLNNRRALSASIVSPELLLIGTFEGDLQALSTRTGALLWSLHKPEAVLSPAAVFEGRAFVGEGLHTATAASLTALSLPEGRVLWQREFRGHLESAPRIDPKLRRAYVTAGPGGLWAIDAGDGSVLWRATLGHVDSPPALREGSLWVGAQPDERKPESRLHELDPETGRSRFELPLPGQPWGNPLLQDERLFVTTVIGQVGPAQPTDRGWSHAVSLTERKLLWSVPLETMALPDSVLLPKPGLLVHAMKNGKLIALDLKDGHAVWTRELGGPCLAAPLWIPERDLLVALPSDGKLALLEPATGRVLQRTDAGANATAAPLYAGGKLFVVGSESITAFELGSGP